MGNVDAIIIGSGQGGIPLAVDLAAKGKKVVLFERGRLGGSCINYGCTPSKAFLASAHGVGRARALRSLGVSAQLEVDFPKVMTRVRSIRDSFEKHEHERLKDVKIVQASAAFEGPRTVTGGGTTVAAPFVLIDTGTTATIPDIAGLAGTPYLTNETFFELQDRPARLVVMGGGYIGLELGQGAARLGSEVHVIDSNERVLDREEADISQVLQTALERDGIKLHLGRKATSVQHDGLFGLTLDDGTQLEAEALLLAVGRTPNTRDLKAPLGQVRLDERGYVVIDESFHTSCEGVFAIGDVAGQPAFTHVSWEDYRRVKAILKGQARTRADRVLAYSTFTEPQVARVGMDARQAQAAGLRVRTVTLDMSEIARAKEWGSDLGFYRLFVDEASGRIVGATLVGYEAGEIVHVILAHIMAGSSWQLLDDSVHIHPTYCEGLPTLARELEAGAQS